MLPSWILNKKFAAVGLNFIAASIVTIATAYVNAIFLTSYPKTYLPFFFIIQALTEIAMAYYFSILLKKNHLENILYIQIGSAFLILFFFYLLPLNLFWIPLLFSVILLTIASLSIVIAWDCIHTAFDVLEFKRSNFLITNMGTIGSIVASFSLLALIKKFHNIDALVYLLFVLILSTCFFIYLLKPIYIPLKKLKRGTSPFQYPLFQILALTGCLTILAYTFIDYSLKLELSETYSQAMIGEFMGLLLGFSNIARIIFDVAIFRLLRRRWNPSVLLMILPIYWLISGVIVFIFPTLWAIVLMASGRYIFQFGAYHPGRELMLDILPQQIRTIGQYQLKSIVGPAATIVGAITLFWLGSIFKISSFAILIIVLNVLALFFMRKIHSTYINTIKEEVRLTRFQPEAELNQEESNIISDLVSKAFSTKDPELIRFGFGILPTLALPVLPQNILNHLEDENVDTRIHTLVTIAHHQLKEAIPLLLDRYQIESDPEVRWHLLNTLAILQAKEFLPIARQSILDTAPTARSGAIRFLITQGNLMDVSQALSSLQTMIDHEDVNMRRNAGRILEYIHIGNLYEELKKLIADVDSIVSSYAIDAASELQMVELVPDLIERAGNPGVFYSVKKALSHLRNEDAIYLLVEHIKNYQSIRFDQTNRYIMLLSSLPNNQAENELYKLAHHENMLIRTTAAKGAAYRAQSLNPHPECRLQARGLALKEARLVILLRYEEKQPHADFVKNELSSRKIMAKQRFIYWLSVYGKSKEILNLMPTVLLEEKTARAKAIAFINVTIRDNQLAQAALNIFIDDRLISDDRFASENIYEDGWLKLVTDFEKNPSGGTMHNLQKVFILRSVELFTQLPSEILFLIAEEMETVEMQAGVTIFKEGEMGDGLYIIASGDVNVIRQGEVVAKLSKNQFFGELSLLDNAPRTGSAIAQTEGVLLFLDKETFVHITNDLPEVLRGVIQAVMRYLRIYLR